MATDVAGFCPWCGERRIGPFCEECGHSFSTSSQSASSQSASSPPAPAALSSWCALIAPDRDYFDTRGADSERFTFPSDSPPRHVPLTGETVRIGRRSGSRGTVPEIDLAEPPADPGVSRDHARLLAQSDGTWALVDDGSTNGTYLNDSTQRIPRHQQVSVADGDRVHLGVWTTITLRRSSRPSPP